MSEEKGCVGAGEITLTFGDKVVGTLDAIVYKVEGIEKPTLMSNWLSKKGVAGNLQIDEVGVVIKKEENE